MFSGLQIVFLKIHFMGRTEDTERERTIGVFGEMIALGVVPGAKQSDGPRGPQSANRNLT
jgi:hypothetical protein